MKDQRQLARYWMEMADESLTLAKLLYDQEHLKFCINRLYYALFYAVSAVFAARGITYSKHSAVQMALHRDLVKTGQLDKDLGKLYDRLFYDRQRADYTAFALFDAAVVKQDIVEVENSLAVLRQLLEDEMPT